uniref:Uncharacterized protein n=1 Tax=Rhizophora mucronata TaxID=61149 RepID=A0A2P2P8W7_RHIMU
MIRQWPSCRFFWAWKFFHILAFWGSKLPTAFPCKRSAATVYHCRRHW